MSLSQYFAIVFSPELSGGSAEQKRQAILQLQDYFQTHDYINTGGEIYYPIAYATEPLLNGKVDLSENFRAKVVHAELTEGERAEVQRIGFHARAVGPAAFTFYNEDYQP